MIILKRDNVERVVLNMAAAEKLVEEGYEILNPSEKAEEANPEEASPEETNLEAMTTEELRQVAKGKGIKGVSSLKKEELLEAIRKAD